MTSNLSPTLIGVAIMGKSPVPGKTKTRLCPELPPEEAALLYRAMLADRCDLVARIPHTVPAIAVAEGLDDALLPPGFELIVQTGAGLGRGLASASEFFAARGLAAVMVDSDSPTLPISFVHQATEALRNGAEVVLGPSEDGGYYLLGLATPQPALLEDMPWSTPDVARLTLERCAALGLRVHHLPSWSDVDTPADLERLHASLFHAWWPTRTAAVLRKRELARLQTAYQLAPSTDRELPTDPALLYDRPSERLLERSVYATPWLSLREDRIRLPSGAINTYSVIDCGECVGILPFSDDETVLLIRQHRYIAGRITWEMPTGGVERGEPHLQAALRELAEEAQVQGELSYLGQYHTSKSVMDETAHLYVARQLTPCVAQCEDTEFLRTERVPFATALAMVHSGEIVDSMTIIAILRVALHRASPAR